MAAFGNATLWLYMMTNVKKGESWDEEAPTEKNLGTNGIPHGRLFCGVIVHDLILD